MRFLGLTNRSITEGEQAFLQRRVALFGLNVGAGFLFFWLYRGLLGYSRGEGLEDPSFWWHLAAAALFFAPFFICYWGPARSVRFVRIVEVASLALGAIATGLMALYIPLDSRPDYILLLALTFALIGRAIFIPSPGWWSLAIALVIGADMLGNIYLRFLDIELAKWAVVSPGLDALTPQQVARFVTIEAGAWWVLTILLTTSTSVVIYGLRRKVRDAEQLGQYRLEEKLGEGGMGVVYRASHAFLRRPTAVKLLPPAKADEQDIRRFEHEVQMTASLTHPNTITVFDYGHTPEGVFYYAMEYVDGLPLDALVTRDGPQPAARVVHLIRQAAAALVEAHGIGLVHRDIKPGNLMAYLLHGHGGVSDFVKVLDFGLVKTMRAEGGIELTNHASLSGTPQYMAPESITSPDQIDGRTDLYALGAVAYYLLTGTHVFSADTIVEVCSHHLHTPPESPSERLGHAVSPSLEAIILSCLAKDPADRPQSALELEQGLSDCSDIEAWSTEDAVAWWQRHGPVVGSPRTDSGVGIMSVHLEDERLGRSQSALG